MRSDSFRLSPRLRAWFYGTVGVLFITGVGWWFFDILGHGDGNFGEFAAIARVWLLKLHGAAATLTLIVLGTLIPLHVRRGWRANLNRTSGLAMSALCILLIVTGYALYYAGGENLRTFASGAHIALGLALPVLLVWHIVRGRRARRARFKAGSAPRAESSSLTTAAKLH